MSKVSKGRVEKGKVNGAWYVKIDPGFQDTGVIEHISEPVWVAEQEQTVPRGSFEIAYMSALFDIFDKLGGKKYTVLQYILKHKDGMNCLNMSNTELAKAAGVGRNTVVDTMKILTDAGVVVRKGTVIRLSARVFVKGNVKKEGYIMRKFVEEQAEQELKAEQARQAAQEQTEEQIPGQMSITDYQETA